MKMRRLNRRNTGLGFRAPSCLRRCNTLGRYSVCAAIVVGLAAGAPPAAAQRIDANEYRLKLAFLYNFAQFVEWPADSFRDAGAPLTICVAGDDPFQGGIEESLRGRAVKGHSMEVRKLGPHDDPRACQMIFVRAAEKKEIPRILASSRGSTILTIGETDGFARDGGVINLTREDNRLRFEFNVDAAAQTRLHISSKLLALAKIVKD